MSELKFTGCADFRMRITLALISGRPVRISQIRARSARRGLSPYEYNLLKLVDKISNGLHVNIGENGTRVYLKPGILLGGTHADTFETSSDRGVGYYLEVLLLLAPFCKNPLDINLKGVCNKNSDPSVDMILQSWLPVYRKFLGAAAADKLVLKLVRRGASPLGGGLVHLQCSPVAHLMPLKASKPGKVYKIRGVAWTCKVSPGICTQMINGAKKVFKNLLSDVYVTADACKGERGGLSPGFGLSLFAETKTGAIYSAELTSQPAGSSEMSVPSELGEQVAHDLCKEIFQGGSVDSGAQGLVLALMALGPRHVSSVVTGPLAPHAISTLRLVKDFTNVQFQLKSGANLEEAEADSGAAGADSLTCVCVGCGRLNFERSAGREREFQAAPLAL